MSKFSRATQLKLSGIVAAGHPPIIHSIALVNGWTDVKAGIPLVIDQDGAQPWDGVDDTVAQKMGICLNDPQPDDRSVLVLLHGCYRADVVTIAGTPITQAQRLPLMTSGLYPEDSWGG